jgi:phosphatidate cytidylyltransferase
VSVLVAAIVAGIAVGAYIGDIEWGLWIAGGATAAVAAAFISPIEDNPAPRYAAWTLGSLLYLGVLGSTMILLRELEFDGREWVYVTVLATFATDTAAYFTGRAVGRTPLAPAISPKKTVEGFLGGCVGGFAAVFAAAYAFEAWGDLSFEPWHLAVIGVTLPLAATAGDLVESAMKRAQHIKDASELIPGHGGVLDRLDSILFTFPAVYLFVEFVVMQ